MIHCFNFHMTFFGDILWKIIWYRKNTLTYLGQAAYLQFLLLNKEIVTYAELHMIHCVHFHMTFIGNILWQRIRYRKITLTYLGPAAYLQFLLLNKELVTWAQMHMIHCFNCHMTFFGDILLKRTLYCKITSIYLDLPWTSSILTVSPAE